MHRGPPTAKSPNLTVKTTITTVITAMTTTIPISATLANREAPPYTSCLSVANGKVCVWGGIEATHLSWLHCLATHEICYPQHLWDVGVSNGSTRSWLVGVLPVLTLVLTPISPSHSQIASVACELLTHVPLRKNSFVTGFFFFFSFFLFFFFSRLTVP